MSNKKHVKRTALKMIKESGLINLSRSSLCLRANIPDGSFPHVMECTFAQFVEELKQLIDTDKQHPVSKTRTDPELRRDQILTAAVQLSVSEGYDKFTRDELAVHADVSPGLINRYFGTMKQLRRAIMRHAVKNELPEIVAQGLVNGDKHAKKAPPNLKTLAAASLK